MKGSGRTIAQKQLRSFLRVIVFLWSAQGSEALRSRTVHFTNTDRAFAQTMYGSCVLVQGRRYGCAGMTGASHALLAESFGWLDR